MWQLFRPESSFPLHHSVSLECGFIVGHSCLLKETEHVMAVTACDTSDQLSQLCSNTCTIQAKLDIEHIYIEVMGTH